MFAGRKLAIGALGASFLISIVSGAAPRKPHVVVLGAAKRVPYSKAGDPAGASAAEGRRWLGKGMDQR
jgi:hypothetical protein